MAKRPFLVTLLPSVDVDLGRWLLQHWKYDYDEHPHAPVFHILALKWYGEGKDDYPLLIADGKKYPAIGAIVQALDPRAAAEDRLVPNAESEKALHDEVMKLQHDFRFGMGAGTVNWAYYNLLPRKDLTWASFTTGVPWWETLFLTFGYGIIKYLMFKGLGLTPEVAQKGLEAVQAGFDQCDQLLSDGRQYLAGDRLTLADLAFATSGAPMVLAKGYGGHLPTIDQVPPEMQAVMTALRARPAGAFIQRLYDQHRLPPAAPQRGAV